MLSELISGDGIYYVLFFIFLLVLLISVANYRNNKRIREMKNYMKVLRLSGNMTMYNIMLSRGWYE